MSFLVNRLKTCVLLKRRPVARGCTHQAANSPNVDLRRPRGVQDALRSTKVRHVRHGIKRLIGKVRCSLKISLLRIPPRRRTRTKVYQDARRLFNARLKLQRLRNHAQNSRRTPQVDLLEQFAVLLFYELLMVGMRGIEYKGMMYDHIAVSWTQNDVISSKIWDEDEQEPCTLAKAAPPCTILHSVCRKSKASKTCRVRR